jgi:ABC-2 type transport system ATP-binding protein
MNSDHAVHLERVVKRFTLIPVVDGVDLSVPRGSIFGFIGPNGSGKTTTMRLILRIYQPEEGRVVVLGNEHGKTADARVGYLPEERGLYRRMTVRGVLRYFAQLKGVRKPDRLIDEQLERMGAQDWRRKRIEQLSKGMAQKIQFIVAVIAKPELIILDEPFSGLDPVNLELMRDVVLELREQGTTVIFSTHDMEVAQRLCDRVFMINSGRKVLDGTIDSIRETHGASLLRVRMAGGGAIPSDLPGVIEQSKPAGGGSFTELQLESDAARHGVLRSLAACGDIEHFETVRPSLHDIFVRIAKPQSEEQVSLHGGGR